MFKKLLLVVVAVVIFTAVAGCSAMQHPITGYTWHQAGIISTGSVFTVPNDAVKINGSSLITTFKVKSIQPQGVVIEYETEDKATREETLNFEVAFQGFLFTKDMLATRLWVAKELVGRVEIK